jgi:preprotein translocase subunit SecD
MKRTRSLWVSIVFVAVLVLGSAAGFLSGSLKPKLGLDLQGGVQVILAAPAGTGADVMTQALQNIRGRVDAFGVGESQIFVSGNTITVQIPGGANGTVSKQNKTQYCLVGSDLSVYGCSAGKDLADQALKDLVVQTTVAQVCVVDTAGKQLQCVGSQSEADSLKAQLTVQPKSANGTATPTAAPSTTPAPSPQAGPYCIVDALGKELACYSSNALATAANKALTSKVTQNTYCVVDGASTTGASPTPSVTPSASPTAKPKPSSSASASASATTTSSPSPPASAFTQLDRATATPLPCGLAAKVQADKALSAITVSLETVTYCVTSSGGKSEGCFVRQADAEQQLKETGNAHLLDVIGQTARLEERQVISVIAPKDPAWATTPLTCSTPLEQSSKQCTDPAQLDSKQVVYIDPTTQDKYVLQPTVITGANIKKATAALPQSQNQILSSWVIQFDLQGKEAKAFADLTGRLAPPSGPPAPTNQIAIALDRKVISSPSVNGQITGSGEITGNFDEQTAKQLATQLNAGSLPVELTRLSVTTVSPTLGQASLKQGIVAGIAGLTLLFAYLLFYYRLLGVVAWVGMSIWAVLAIAIVSLAGRVGYALSLAGIAGLAISLGVTADSYIVFFERLKDEVRNGKSPRSAVQPAFKRAFRTIVAADMVTAIAAVVLYITAVSSVRGFALTLGVATMLDLFVVWFFKRPTVFLISRNERLVQLRGFGLSSGVAAEARDRPKVQAGTGIVGDA